MPQALVAQGLEKIAKLHEGTKRNKTEWSKELSGVLRECTLACERCASRLRLSSI